MWSNAWSRADSTKMMALNDFGSPNNLQSVLTQIEAIGPEEFLGGYTWTEEALQMAEQEFAVNSQDDSAQKVIVLVTDGEPWPHDHEPCRSSTGYISPTLQALKESEVLIIAVGIALSGEAVVDFFQCMVDDLHTDFFYAQDFDALPDLGDSIGARICDELETKTTMQSTNDAFSSTLP
eukprot:TRINITY_DN2203_c0_g1_i1.p1 TRINITY_DN2203_c0_g1~~TRINITY_DN2203_c0_g1_i1.p1  ORF type:complete len:187 (+),score=33.98 TRINITY_DN2203_c0_g1_i1:27-563(+)